MACAKKCDRCGKLYEQYNSKNDRKNPNGIMVLNLDSQRRYFAHNALDLCPDCMKGFQDWFGKVKQMERLTERVYDGLIIIKQDSGDEGNYKAADKLATYEDLEEQGLLVKLPANNKEIYIISSRWTVCSECGSRFDEYSCSGCEYECDSKKEYYVYPTYLSSITVSTYVDRFGKTIFLTREEAEKKLEELKNEI